MKKYIGIDLGGTNIKVARILQNGTVEEMLITSTIAPVMDKIKDLVDKLSKGQDISGIGAGLPGLVDDQNGIFLHAPNIQNFDMVDFRSAFPGIHLINDGNAACFAEYKFGALKGYKNSLMLTLGTGIGGGLIADGKLYTGSNSYAIEIGKLLLGSQTPWEEQLHNEFRPEYVDILAMGIANLCNIFFPDIIAIGGGISLNGDKLFVPLNKQVNDGRILGSQFSKYKVDIVPSKLGYNAGLIGAALFYV